MMTHRILKHTLKTWQQRIIVCLLVSILHIMVIMLLWTVKIPDLPKSSITPLVIEMINLNQTKSASEPLVTITDNSNNTNKNNNTSSNNNTNNTIKTTPKNSVHNTLNKPLKSLSTISSQINQMVNNQPSDKQTEPEKKNELGKENELEREKKTDESIINPKSLDNQTNNFFDEQLSDNKTNQKSAIHQININKDGNTDFVNTSNDDMHTNGTYNTGTHNTMTDVADEGHKTTQNDMSYSVLEQNWQAQVRLQLEHHLIYPKQALAKQWGGQVFLKITVDANGVVQAVTIAKSSSKNILDNEAIATTKRASPLPPPPATLLQAKKTITFNVPMSFNYQKYQ